MIISIANLLSNLMRTTPLAASTDESAKNLEIDTSDNSRIATTIRLEPQLRSFVDRHAVTMGLSRQDFITMTLRAVMIASEQPKAGELDLMVSRFFDVFTAYNINAADIIALLPANSLSRADLEHRDRILNAMSKEFIEHIAKTFVVSINWLKGSSDYCIDSNMVSRWYKSPTTFARALLRLKLTQGIQRVSVAFITDEFVDFEALTKAKVMGVNAASVNVTPVIVCDRSLNNIQFTTFEIWETERWNYAPCRRDLKLMMMLCERSRISIDGYSLPKEKYEQFSRNKILPPLALKHPRRTWPIDDVIWKHNQNPEIEELGDITNSFNESKLPLWSDALNQYYRVVNIEQVIDGVAMPKFE